MFRRVLPLALAAACASKGGEGARGQGETPPEVVIPPAPEGSAWKTARGASWNEMLEDLAGADVVFVSGGVELPVLDYLYKRGRLHAIGVEAFPRTAQAALDDFSFGRIDAAELERRCGALAEGDRAILAFAAERRVPVLGLGLEPEIAAAVAEGGVASLSEEQRRSLPATNAAAPAADGVDGLRMDVAADLVVGWYRAAAPEGAQVAVLSARIAPRSLLPERLFARSGKAYRTLVAVEGKPETVDPSVFSRSYADYVWLR